MQRIRLSPGREIVAVLALLLFWAWLCRDILTQFFTRLYISGSEIDMIGQLWMSWWAHQAFASPDHSLFFCPLLNYPLGVETFTYHVAFVHVLVSGLLRPALGMIGSINAMFVYGLLLSLVGMYTLLRQVTDSRFSAALFATLPILHASVLSGFVDIEQVNLGYMTLGLASWLALMRRGGPVLTATTGILIGLACITQMYYGIFLLLFLGLAVVLGRFNVSPVDQPFEILWKRTAIAAGIGVIIGIVPLIPSALTIGRISIYEPIPFFINSPAPLPAFLHPVHLLPIPILGILIGWTARKDRKAWFWFAAMTLFLLLAVGPHLEIGGTRVPMPFWFLRQTVPLFWRLSMPVRFGRMAIILLALLFVLYHSRWLHRLSGRVALSILLAIPLFLVANFVAPMMLGNSPLNVPGLTPIPTEEPMPVPKFFQRLGKEPSEGTAFDLRCEVDAQLSAYYQMFHRLPISGMPLIAPNLRTRLPNSGLTQLQNRFCQAVDSEGAMPEMPDPDWWRKQNVRYLFLASTFVSAAGPEFLAEWEANYGAPLHQYQYVRIYELRDQ